MTEEPKTEAPVVEEKEQIEIIRSDVAVTCMLRGRQIQYGVHENQFIRYAKYCTTRCARIRKILNIKGGKDYSLNPSIHQNGLHLELLILMADGCETRYKELKNSATGGQRRQHALRRLRKSLIWWNRAKEAAKVFGTERTQLEINAFADNAEATLELELGHWENALKKFINVTEVFKGLSAVAVDSTFKKYCKDLIDDIEPLLVFCRYNLGESDTVQASAELREKVKSIVSIGAVSSSSRKVQELKWRDWTIPINHEGLKAKIASILDLIADTRSEIHDNDLRITLFDRLIAESHGARQVVHTLSAQNPENQDLAKLDLFLRWNSFIATLERSHALVETFPTAAERAEFAGRTYSRVVDVRPQFEDDAAIEALEYLWHAVKCYYIADAKKGAESITMLERAKTHAEKAISIITKENIEDPPSLKLWCETFLTQIRKRKIEAIAAVNGLKDAKQEIQRPFFEDLKSYEPCKTLVSIPPTARKVTPKPMIFDLAGDYLEFPSLDNKLKKKGFFSKLSFW